MKAAPYRLLSIISIFAVLRHSGRCGLYLLCCMVSVNLLGQTTEALSIPTAAQAWLSTTFKIDLAQRWRLALSAQARSDNDQRHLADRLFLETILRYDLPKGFVLRAGYRYGQRPERNPQHRFWSNASYTPDLGKHWILKLTAQWQTDIVAQRPNQSALRPQIDLAYRHRKKSKLVPEINFDLFYRLDYRYQTVERYRIGGGLSYPIHKRGDLSVKYMWQRSLNIDIPQIDHIISVGYDLDIGPKLKKENKNDKQKEETQPNTQQ